MDSFNRETIVKLQNSALALTGSKQAYFPFSKFITNLKTSLSE